MILVTFSNPGVHLTLFLLCPGIIELSRKMVNILSKYFLLFSIILPKNLDHFGPYFGKLRIFRNMFGNLCPKKLAKMITGK